MGAQTNVNEGQLQDIQSQIDQLTGKTPETPAAQPITLNIGGKPVTYDSAKTLQADIEGLIAHAAQLKQQAQAVPQRPVGGQVTGDEPEEWNKAKFADLLVDDPRKAWDYIESTTGRKKQITQLQQTIAAQNQKLTIYEFTDQNKDFPVTNPGAWTALETILKQNNLPVTTSNLAMAYDFAKNRGYIQPLQQAAPQQPQQVEAAPEQPQWGQQQYSQNVRQMPQRPVGLPSVPRGNAGGNEADIMRRAESLNLDQLRQLINQQAGS